MILSLPVSTSGTTLSQFYTELNEQLKKKIDRKFSPEQKRAAMRGALEACEPLGAPLLLMGTTSAVTRQFIVPGRVTLLQDVQITTVMMGFSMPHLISPGAVIMTMNPSGQALLNFPLPVPAGAEVMVRCLVQPPLPELDSDIIQWPWLDLLKAYAMAELMSEKFFEGAAADIMQYETLGMEWRMQGDSRKLSIMQSLGLAPAEPEETKKKKK